MLKRKSYIASAILAAVALAALTACGGRDTTAPETVSAAGPTAEAAKEEAGAGTQTLETETVSEENQAYLDQVDTMNKATEEFIAISRDFMQLLQDEPENKAALTESIEKTRATKQAFLDFAAIDNPPKGLEEPHARLAEAAANYADTLDIYCDVLLAGINDETHEAAGTIQDDWTNAANDLSDAMGEVQKAASN